MELKSQLGTAVKGLYARFNRTFMELKYVAYLLTQAVDSGLIVPLWN